MEALLIILVSVGVAIADWFLRTPRKKKGRHALGQPNTYYVMQRQFVRRRLQHKVRVYIPARSMLA